MAAVATPVVVPRDPVYVIAHRRTLWGWHMEARVHDGTRHSQVVAFERRMDAEHVAHRLWIHRLKAHRWPDRIITDKRPFGLLSDHDILLTSPNPLTIDPIYLDELKSQLAKSNAAVSYVSSIIDDDGVTFSLQGRYVQSMASAADQVAWLELMLKQARLKSD